MPAAAARRESEALSSAPATDATRVASASAPAA